MYCKDYKKQHYFRHASDSTSIEQQHRLDFFFFAQLLTMGKKSKKWHYVLGRWRSRSQALWLKETDVWKLCLYQYFCTTNLRPPGYRVEPWCCTPFLHSTFLHHKLIKPQAKENTTSLKTLHIDKAQKFFLWKTLLITKSKAVCLTSAWCSRDFG